jgi:hypothetical protein
MKMSLRSIALAAGETIVRPPEITPFHEGSDPLTTSIGLEPGPTKRGPGAMHEQGAQIHIAPVPDAGIGDLAEPPP